MTRSIVITGVVLSVIGFVLPAPAWAGCEACAVHRYPKDDGSTTTISGTPLGKGRAAAGFTIEHRAWDELGHRNAHELHEDGRHVHNFSHDEFYRFSAGYGLTDFLEVAGSLPIVDKTFLRVEDGVVGQGDSSTGVGDLWLTAKSCVARRPANLAVLAGVKFPTGDTSERGFDGTKLGVEEVAGTGSFDYLLGLAVGKALGRGSVGADLLYTIKTKGAQDQEFGDVVRADLSAAYAVRRPGLFPNVHLTAELNAHWMAQDRGRSGKVFDSGGELLFLTPGLSLDLTPQTTVFGAVPLPVAQNWGGEHSEIRYEVVTGVSWRR